MICIKVDVVIIGVGSVGMIVYCVVKVYIDSIVVIEGGVYGIICVRVGCMLSKLFISVVDVVYMLVLVLSFGVMFGVIKVDGWEVMVWVCCECDCFVGFVVELVEVWLEEYCLCGKVMFFFFYEFLVGLFIIVEVDCIVVVIGFSFFVLEGWCEMLGDWFFVNDDVFEWIDLFSLVVVVGSGVIGFELVQVLYCFGVMVCFYGCSWFIGLLSDLVVVVEVMCIFFEEVFVSLGVKVIFLCMEDGCVLVVFEDFEGVCSIEIFDFLIVVIGCKFNMFGIGLDKVGIGLDSYGLFMVDCVIGQSICLYIFVVGDVNGMVDIFYEVVDDGCIVGDNVGCYLNVCFCLCRVLLGIVFFNFQIVMVGVIFWQLIESGVVFEVGEVLFVDQGCSWVMLENYGVICVYVDSVIGIFLGVEMVGLLVEYIGYLFLWSVQW